jgi:hypothetical protein
MRFIRNVILPNKKTNYSYIRELFDPTRTRAAHRTYTFYVRKRISHLFLGLATLNFLPKRTNCSAIWE